MVNLLRYFIEIQSSTAEMIKRNYVTINTKLRKEKKQISVNITVGCYCKNTNTKLCRAQILVFKTRSSAVAERLRNTSCHWIFREVTQDHSRSFEMIPLSRLGQVPY